MGKPKHLQAVMEYAMETAESQHVEEMQRLAARRFLQDLRSGRWEFRPGLPEFLIDTVEGLFCFSQGERLDGAPLRDRPDHPAMLAALSAGDLPAVGRQLANVFQPALALAEVEAICDEMAAFSPLGCCMTGSGSVAYGLFACGDIAAACAAQLARRWPVAMVCRPCGGPVITVEK
jgi:hypothetical protein